MNIKNKKSIKAIVSTNVGVILRMMIEYQMFVAIKNDVNNITQL